MITDIKRLKKIADILNSEGTILGLYSFNDELYLASYLTNKTGMVYYSTTKEKLLQYLQNKIILKQLYLECDDFIVSREFRNDTVTFFKQDFVDLLQCGDKYYNELSDSLKNSKIEDLINGS